MSELRDRKTYQSLKLAWRSRIKQRGLHPSFQSKLLPRAKAIFGFLFLTLVISSPVRLIALGLDLSPDRQLASIIITLSCLGCMLGCWCHFRLSSPIDAEILAPTPIEDKTILRHSLRDLIPTLFAFFLITSLVAVTADEEIKNNAVPPFTWFITCHSIMLISASIFLIMGNYLNALRVFITAFAILIILGVCNVVFHSAHWPDIFTTQLRIYWPASWPIDHCQGKLSTLQIILLAAILGTAIYYLLQQAKTWKFYRALVEITYFDEFDDDEYMEMMHDDENEDDSSSSPLSGSARSRRHQRCAARLELILEDFQHPLHSKFQWIEWFIWKWATRSQRDLISIRGLPAYTKRWRRSLLACAIGIIVLHFNTTDFPYHYALGILQVFIFAYAALAVAPLSSYARMFTERVQISQQNLTYCCVTLPIASSDIVQLRWKEGLIRTLFATPILTSILWFFHWDTHYTGTTFFIWFNCGLVALWCQLNWINLLSANAFIYSSESTTSPQQGFFFSLLCLALVLVYLVLFLGTAFVAYAAPNINSLPTILIAASVSALVGFGVLRLSLRYYRSSRTDLTSIVK